MDKMPKQRKKRLYSLCTDIKKATVFSSMLYCAQSLQSHPAFCYPMDCNLPGYSEASILEWVTHALLQGTFLTQGSNPHPLNYR